MTRINQIINNIDAKETLLDQFDVEFFTDDIEENLTVVTDDEDPMDLIHWAAGFTSKY